jgi:hypothetical protein
MSGVAFYIGGEEVLEEEGAIGRRLYIPALAHNLPL